MTRQFFARVQNQLHWAIHGETAAEVICHRADSEKEHMGLTTWKDAPDGKIQKIAADYVRLETTAYYNIIEREKLEMGQLREVA